MTVAVGPLGNMHHPGVYSSFHVISLYPSMHMYTNMRLVTILCTSIPSSGCRDTLSCYMLDELLSCLSTVNFLTYGVICQINERGNKVFLKRA